MISGDFNSFFENRQACFIVIGGKSCYLDVSVVDVRKNEFFNTETHIFKGLEDFSALNIFLQNPNIYGIIPRLGFLANPGSVIGNISGPAVFSTAKDLRKRTGLI